MSVMKQLVRGVTPPYLWRAMAALARTYARQDRGAGDLQAATGQGQDLGVYSDKEFADELEDWGEGNVWLEILYLFILRKGRVLDIACGMGRNIVDLMDLNPALDVCGFDISDYLIDRGIKNGVSPERVKVCSALDTFYEDNAFDYGYSIGSLEHFDEESLGQCLRETTRVIGGSVFHMVPVSRSGEDEGWIKTTQSFHNNSVAWWRKRFMVHYETVDALDSRWNDDISVGKWFVCAGKRP